MNSAEQVFANAMAAFNGRNMAVAERLFKQFLQMAPGHFGALNLLTVTLIATGRFGEAETYISRAVAINDKSDASFYNYGIILKALGRPKEALAQFNHALGLNPRHVKALNNRGSALSDLGRYDDAIAEFDRAIAVDARYFDAHYNKGNALSAVGRYEDACTAYATALAVQPDSPEAHNNRGRALDELNRRDEAIASYDRAISLRPAYAEAHVNRGSVLSASGRLDQAMANYERAIAIRPDYAEAYNNRAVAFTQLRRLDEAIADYDKAIAIKPSYAEAHRNRGNALRELRRLVEAIASYDKAIAIKPDHAEVHNNRGVAYKELKRPNEAVASYDKAIAIKPDFAQAYYNRGNAFKESKRLNEALASYDKAISLDSGLELLVGEAFHTRMQTCNWLSYREDILDLVTRIESGANAVSPFIALSSFDSCATQFSATKTWVGAKFAATTTHPFLRKYPRREKIRIGYYSSDLRQHPMTYLMTDVFRSHDRSSFETYAYSFDNPPGDELNQRIRQDFDHFIDVSKLSDREVASLSREHAIDIAVDLAGFTAGRRTDILAQRSAPIQVNFLGFPGTMGAEFIDYIIADPMVIDDRRKRFFTEKIVYLPDTYYPTSYGSDLFQTDKVFERAELGLPEDAFVFCCFNNNYKITPDVFDVWMRIMREVDRSILWLFEDNATAVDNLRKEARTRGVDPQRLIFAGRMPLAEHLARLRLGELFLDTLPYNAHTTATDALWAGVPILTKIGETFAGRVAASVLRAIGASELITDTYARYEALAIELARNADALAAVKRSIADNRLTAALFDTARYTRNLEKAYTTMYERHHRDQSPDDIVVAP